MHLHSYFLNDPTKSSQKTKKLQAAFENVFLFCLHNDLYSTRLQNTQRFMYCFVFVFVFCFFLGEKKSFLKDVKISANWQEHNLSIGSMKASNLQSNWDGYKDWINTT